MYDRQVMAPNMHRSIFSVSCLCILTCIAGKLQVIYGRSAYWMSALPPETFLKWYRVAWEIWLESYILRNVSVVLWATLSAYTTSPLIHCYLGHNYMHDNKTHVPYDCTLHTKWWIYCQRHIILQKQSWLAILHIAEFFNESCRLILKLLRGSTIYITLRACRQAAEKEQ